MRTSLGTLAVTAVLLVMGVHVTHAQMMNGYGPDGTSYGMMGAYGSNEAASTSQASSNEQGSETTGAALWKKLTSGETTCASLTDDDFDALGDYFMGSMMGAGHDAMDQYMTHALGETGDREMHIAMGKRISGCDPSAAYPAGGNAYLPMMMGGYGMLGGRYDSPIVYGHEHWFELGPFGWLPCLLLIALIVVGIVWLVQRSRKSHGSSPALDILKERYARGDIDEKEFTAMKKTLQ